MMPIIGIPVKLSCRLGFDISLMAVMERIQEEKISEYMDLFCILEYHCNSTLYIFCLSFPEGESRNSEGF